MAANEPSLYLRCDGKPNNTTDGETFARLLGAVTLLGLFAPSPEAPDPEARLFGMEGVDACSQLIDGTDSDSGEGNAVRRIPLILARALHYVEALDYPAALVDVDRARAEASAAGLVGNPYFDRSMGLSFNNIEAAVHLRMGNPERAREVSLSTIADMRYSFVPNLFARDYGKFLHDLSPEAEIRGLSTGKIMPTFLFDYANLLDEAGRCEESAKVYEAFVTVFDSMGEGPKASAPYARVAVAHALAGNWEKAGEWAERAQRNMNTRNNGGQPEDNSSQVVELLDLHNVLNQANNGDMTMARRLFAARSQWTVPSFGMVMATTRQLREGAAEDELFGSLALSADELWQRRYDELLAVQLQQDTENDALFDKIVSYAKVDDFEDRARNTYRLDRSRMMSDEPDDDGQWAITGVGNPYSSIDSVVLHAALQARHRGKQGFTMVLGSPRAGYGGAQTTGWVRFVDRGEDGAEDGAEDGVSDLLFIAADEVIAELGEVIPPQEIVRERQRERRANR